MSKKTASAMTRRSKIHHPEGVMRSSPAGQGGQESARLPSTVSGVNRYSAPSELRITDVRACTIAGAERFIYPTIRIDTNQGVSGLGEVFVLGNAGQALVFKPYLVGKNPLEMEPILQSIRRFINQDASGGYSAIDMALHDIAGKVYGVPVWRLLGNKLRDRIQIYCDTRDDKDPKVYGARMAERQKLGFTFFKMDLHTHLVADKPGAVHRNGAATEVGLKHLCEMIEAVRDAIGWDAPLAADHFGNLSVKDCIRYARAFERYQLAWAEDMLPYTDWQGLKAISEASTTPQLTGEYGFGLKEAFRPLIDHRAVDFIHPDVTVCGGLLELRRIAEYADLNGIPVALHLCNGPVAQAAALHAAAVMMNFVALEYHAVECPFWADLVTGPVRPIVEQGFMRVPDAPGLGVELNEEVVEQHLKEPGYFEPTPMYDRPILGGRPSQPNPNSWRLLF